MITGNRVSSKYHSYIIPLIQEILSMEWLQFVEWSKWLSYKMLIYYIQLKQWYVSEIGQISAYIKR